MSVSSALDALDRDLAAVEAAAQLDARLLVDAGRVPRRVESARLLELSKVLRKLERVERPPLRHHRLPLLLKSALELRGVDRQVLARGERRLLGDRVVVLVDVPLAVDLLAGDHALLEHVDGLLAELGLDHLEHGGRVGVRLGEDERGVHDSTPCRGGGGALNEGRRYIQVLYVRRLRSRCIDLRLDCRQIGRDVHLCKPSNELLSRDEAVPVLVKNFKQCRDGLVLLPHTQKVHHELGRVDRTALIRIDSIKHRIDTIRHGCCCHEPSERTMATFQ